MDKVEKFIDKYPALYHMAEARSWDSIRKHGLLSVAALLDLFGVGGVKHHELYSMWRGKNSHVLRHSAIGSSIVRDQHPIPPERLKRVLSDGLTPRDWYEQLNRRCFFWVDECRLSKMMGFYKGDSHDVIVVDTKKLVERHLKRITVSHINSSTVRSGQHLRGNNTFQEIESFPLFGKEKKDVAELTVEGSVPDIEELAIQVTRRKGPLIEKILWPE